MEIATQFGNLLFSLVTSIPVVVFWLLLALLAWSSYSFVTSTIGDYDDPWDWVLVNKRPILFRLFGLLVLVIAMGAVSGSGPRVTLPTQHQAPPAPVNTTPLVPLKPSPYKPTTPEERAKQMRDYDKNTEDRRSK